MSVTDTSYGAMSQYNISLYDTQRYVLVSASYVQWTWRKDNLKDK